jgi:hypothetical protein
MKPASARDRIGAKGEDLPGSGGLLMSMVCMAMMFSPRKLLTYFNTWKKWLTVL